MKKFLIKRLNNNLTRENRKFYLENEFNKLEKLLKIPSNVQVIPNKNPIEFVKITSNKFAAHALDLILDHDETAPRSFNEIFSELG